MEEEVGSKRYISRYIDATGVHTVFQIHCILSTILSESLGKPRVYFELLFL